MPLDPDPGLDRIAYGGDYNPEQWPEQVWADDVALMREAGVNLVSVGIFAWATAGAGAGRVRVRLARPHLDLLHDAGIAVDLATPTAAPPPWFLHRHPDAGRSPGTACGWACVMVLGLPGGLG